MIADDRETLDTRQLRQALRVSPAELAFKQPVIDKLTHENAFPKRLKLAATAESCSAEQKSLLDETLDADLAAVAAQTEAMVPSAQLAEPKQPPYRQPLPANLARREISHEPDATLCGCGTPMQRSGEDVAGKMDDQPGVFTVERHIRSKWVSRCCDRMTQARVAAHLIDTGRHCARRSRPAGWPWRRSPPPLG